MSSFSTARKEKSQLKSSEEIEKSLQTLQPVSHGLEFVSVVLAGTTGSSLFMLCGTITVAQEYLPLNLAVAFASTLGFFLLNDGLVQPLKTTIFEGEMTLLRRKHEPNPFTVDYTATEDVAREHGLELIED